MSAPAVSPPSTNPNHQVAAPVRRRPKAKRKVVKPTRAFSTDIGIRARITSVSAMGSEGGQVLLVAGPFGIEVRRHLDRGRRPGHRPVRAPLGGHPGSGTAGRPPAGQPSGNGKARTGGGGGGEHRDAGPDDTGRPPQLEDDHRGDGEGEAGQGGQQPQPGIEGGQVGLDQVLAGAGSSQVDDRRAVGRGGVGRRGRPGVRDDGGLGGDGRTPWGRRPRRACRGRPSPGPGPPWSPGTPWTAPAWRRPRGTAASEWMSRARNGTERRPAQRRGHHHGPAGPAAAVDQGPEGRGHHGEGAHGQQQVRAAPCPWPRWARWRRTASRPATRRTGCPRPS